MDIREECLKAIETGLPKAVLAKKINRDPSTLYKWLNGSRKISKEVEAEITSQLQIIKQQWENINV